jgi:hypothetical protein
MRGSYHDRKEVGIRWWAVELFHFITVYIQKNYNRGHIAGRSESGQLREGESA